ncbi:hypothetical protein FHR75_003676 [Kineococcus radiotolerans]|uniref:Uncharacterized protein n=1 Tax=Kineococcus radiotolerans TaxID=131568 RepID=A0A7W4TPR2_KINRA|nr:hypothetical protein [Kineococcus radiotolerans]MBB2902840.1 hypothetical protein [Kineococcus radiotolerans]
MIRRSTSARRPPASQDEGFALMGVMMLMLVMLMVCSVVVAAVVQGGQFQRKQQDWNAALAAAQAGVDDYIQRLNSSNGSYYQYNGVTSIDPGNPAMGMVNGKPRFAEVPQTTGAQRAYFHYTADTAAYIGTASVAQTGVITVTSTGRVGDRTRTLQTQVRRSGFLETLYFTEYETQDPAQSGMTQCAGKHYYDGRSSSCTNIMFDSDVLTGPVHSNDTMLICSDVTFKGKVTTASPVQSGGRYYRTNSCNGNTSPAPAFSSGVPTRTGIVPIPSTNQSLKQKTASTSTPRGCLFVGPTTITLNGNQMYVRSPWTKDTPVCQLNQWIPIPANGVVYVDDRPANGTTDVNSWTNATATPVTNMCATAPGGSGNPVGYPVSQETGWTYSCTDGDVFIQELNGSASNGLTGRLTVAAAGSIYITDNLHYASGSAMLGLIADQNVWYWHGTNSNGGNINLPAKTFPTQAAKSAPLLNPTVSAAMVSLNHSIGTMNPGEGGSLGTLTINGNLTQLYRGIVRSGSAGYAKNYVYDQRLKYDAPPHFLNPTTSTFVSTLSAEVPGYTPTA